MQPASACSSWPRLADLIRRPHLYEERKVGPTPKNLGGWPILVAFFATRVGPLAGPVRRVHSVLLLSTL